MTTPTLTIDGAPVAVVPVEPTEAMQRDMAAAARDFFSEAGPYPRTKATHRAMLSASDPALTDAVVETRDALAQMVRDWASDDPTAEGQDVVNRARAALARVEVSR